MFQLEPWGPRLLALDISGEICAPIDLREFACELTSSWPPARVEGRVWGALLGQDPLNPVNPASVPECVFWSNTPTLLADFYEERYSGTV